MNSSDLIRLRLACQHLARPSLHDPAQVVEWLGAVQAQEYAISKWSVGQRLRAEADEIAPTDARIERAVNEGTIVRTHVMRPTWHFIHPADARWMLELTAPQVKKTLASYNRKLELDDAVFGKTSALIEKALQNRIYLTRQELKALLATHGIETNVQRLAHILMWAELDGLICNGPRQGKQFTYALMAERIPEAASIPRDEALARLARKYFQSHGPAQVKDFAWWSGLSMADARQAIATAQPALVQTNVDGKQYWHTGDTPVLETGAQPEAFLLSVFDEYTIAYKDRSLLTDEEVASRLQIWGNTLSVVMVLRGKVMGAWKHTLYKDRIEVRLNPVTWLSAQDQRDFAQAADRFGRFLELPAVLMITR